MIFLEHTTELVFHLKDIIIAGSVLVPAIIAFFLVKYRLNVLEKRVDGIIKKQDDFKSTIYRKLEENNQCMHNIELSIEKLRSELLIKIKK